MQERGRKKGNLFSIMVSNDKTSSTYSNFNFSSAFESELKSEKPLEGASVQEISRIVHISSLNATRKLILCK